MADEDRVAKVFKDRKIFLTGGNYDTNSICIKKIKCFN